jgi:hypothetical protein
MMTEEILSFRKGYWTSCFPIEARYYQYGRFGPARTLTTQMLSSPEALQTFQDELTRRENAQEWGFIAYYTPMVTQQRRPG